MEYHSITAAQYCTIKLAMLEKKVAMNGLKFRDPLSFMSLNYVDKILHICDNTVVKNKNTKQK